VNDPTSDPRAETVAELLGGLGPDEVALVDRLVAALADRPARTVAPALRAQRFELVDDYGRVRAVLGDLAGAEGGWCPGLSLRSGEGSQRVCLLLHRDGAMLNFTMVGNDALVLGVAEPHTDAYDPGPYVRLCDSEGDTVMAWRVDQEDGLVTEGPGAEGAS
jgi:hypothetical protein